MVSIGMAIVSFQRAEFTLSMKKAIATDDKGKTLPKIERVFQYIVFPFGMGILFFTLSLMFIGRHPFIEFVEEPLVRADFAQEEVSIKPDNWTVDDEDISLAKGADLEGADLRFAKGAKSFLVKADLRDANLEGADLREADLREALFQEETLFEGIVFGEGIFSEGVFGEVGRKEAKLKDVDFKRAKLNKVNFSFMKLEGVNFHLADFNWANFRGTDLSKTRNLTQDQIENTCMDGGTRLPERLKSVGCKGDVKKYWDERLGRK
jgi:hypothetical protein